MKLPQADKAVVDQEKITGYLLNAAPPDNGGKAAFFQGLGFKPDDWLQLADAFRRLAESGEVHNSMATPHGHKYIVDGLVESPNGKSPVVRTVWIVDMGFDTPRLVTAYPQNE